MSCVTPHTRRMLLMILFRARELRPKLVAVCKMQVFVRKGIRHAQR
jgi:hypothetical protein